MINISSLDGSLIVNGNSAVPYHTIDTYNSKPMQGHIRLNGSSLEYWDGNMWCYMPTPDYTVQLDPTIRDWITKKMVEEQRVERLAEAFPALATAKKNYDTILALVESEDNGTTTS